VGRCAAKSRRAHHPGDERLTRASSSGSLARSATCFSARRSFGLRQLVVATIATGFLLDLPLDDVQELAAAAIRQAEAAMQSPDLVEMPRLPRGSVSSPNVVRLHAKACLPARKPTNRDDHAATATLDCACQGWLSL